MKKKLALAARPVIHGPPGFFFSWIEPFSEGRGPLWAAGTPLKNNKFAAQQMTPGKRQFS